MTEKRTEERSLTHRRAILIDKDCQATPVQILDVSRNGVGVESYIDPGLSLGDSVRLKVREHTLSGEVMRVSTEGTNSRIGLRLSTADGLLLA